jgi:L-ascorbate metabolism protein UlaG (beta-lactamase superfamily)
MIEPLQSDAGFLADIERASRESPEKLHLWWLGQSGYLLRHRETTLLIDPYLSDSLTTKYMGTAKPHVRMHRRVVDPAELGRTLGRIDLVTSSHAHTDHLDPQTLQPLVQSARVRYFLVPRAIRDLAVERSNAASVREPPTVVE